MPLPAGWRERVLSLLGESAALRRDRKVQVTYPAGTARGTIVCLAVGIVAWAIFAFFLHGPLIGVRPLA